MSVKASWKRPLLARISWTQFPRRGRVVSVASPDSGEPLIKKQAWAGGTPFREGRATQRRFRIGKRISLYNQIRENRPQYTGSDCADNIEPLLELCVDPATLWDEVSILWGDPVGEGGGGVRAVEYGDRREKVYVVRDWMMRTAPSRKKANSVPSGEFCKP